MSELGLNGPIRVPNRWLLAVARYNAFPNDGLAVGMEDGVMVGFSVHNFGLDRGWDIQFGFGPVPGIRWLATPAFHLEPDH